MAHVVFLRGVNVAGTRSFKPSQLAADLSDLDVVSIGAAGTFVVRANVDADTIEVAFEEQVPFETEVLVRDADEVSALLDEEAPFGADGELDGVKAYVTVLAEAPADEPTLPIDRPDDGPWQVRIVRVDDLFALTVRRTEVRGRYYPNEVVEKALGVAATTRGWPTMERIGRVLDDG